MAKSLYRTISEQIADHLRSDIMSGQIAEESLLKEQELSDRFEVSRGTVRYALMQLVSEGLVISTPNIGMRVANHPSEESLGLIVSIRNRIEDFLLKKVFTELRNKHLEEWGLILNEMHQASKQNDIEAFMDTDIRFHRFFIELYSDKHLRDLWEMARSRMMMRYNRLKDLEAGYLEHERIYEAVKAGKLDHALSNLHNNVI